MDSNWEKVVVIEGVEDYNVVENITIIQVCLGYSYHISRYVCNYHFYNWDDTNRCIIKKIYEENIGKLFRDIIKS